MTVPKSILDSLLLRAKAAEAKLAAIREIASRDYWGETDPLEFQRAIFDVLGGPE